MSHLRKFDGLHYRRIAHSRSSRISEIAEHARKIGYNARVVKSANGKQLYIRPSPYRIRQYNQRRKRPIVAFGYQITSYNRDEKDVIEEAFKRGFEPFPKQIPVKACSEIDGTEECESFRGAGELMQAAFAIGFGEIDKLPSRQEIRKAMLPALVQESTNEESTNIVKAVESESLFQNALENAIARVRTSSFCECGSSDPEVGGRTECQCSLITVGGEYIEFQDIVDDTLMQLQDQVGAEMNLIDDLGVDVFGSTPRDPLRDTLSGLWDVPRMPVKLKSDGTPDLRTRDGAKLAQLIAIRKGFEEAGFIASPRQLLDTFENAQYAVRRRSAESYGKSSIGREEGEIGERWAFAEDSYGATNIEPGPFERDSDDDGVLYDYTWHSNLRDALIDARSEIRRMTNMAQTGSQKGLRWVQPGEEAVVEILRAPALDAYAGSYAGTIWEQEAVKYGELTIDRGILKWEVFLENLVDDDSKEVESARERAQDEMMGETDWD